MRQMTASGQANVNTLVFEQGGKQQQWLPAKNFPSLFKNPTCGGVAMRNPMANSIPIKGGIIESPVWQGRPSAWKLLWLAKPFFLVVLVAVIVVILWRRIPVQWYNIVYTIMVGIVSVFLLLLLWELIKLKATSWLVTTERLRKKERVFSRSYNNLELYRIKDIALQKPLLMRLVRRGYVCYWTSDQSDKDRCCIGPIYKPDDLYEILRKYVERQRQQRGVKEIDFWHA